MKSAFRTVSVVLAVGLLALGLSGCKKDAAAIVNGEVISKTSIDQQLQQLSSQYPQMFQGKDGEQRKAEFRQRLIDNAVSTVLIKQEAERQGITVSDSQIESQTAELKKGFPNEAAFQDALKKNGITLDELKQREKENLLSQRLIEKLTAKIDPSEKELNDYYQKNKSTVFEEKASVHAWHILFDEKDKATAEKVLGQLKSGGNFAALAKQYSKDPGSKEKGGDLGWPTTPYVPEFQAALDKMKAGEISGLVKSQFGYHIIKVIEKRPARIKSFDQVKDQVRQMLIQQQQADVFQKLLDELKKKAKIEYPKS